MMMNDELRQPMARAKSSPARTLRSRRWNQAAHTKNAIAYMKSAVDEAATSAMGEARKARAMRSPLGRPNWRTSRAIPITATAVVSAVARLMATWPSGSSTATIASYTGTPGVREGW